MDFLRISYDFLWISLGFPMISRLSFDSQWISLGFPKGGNR